MKATTIERISDEEFIEIVWELREDMNHLEELVSDNNALKLIKLKEETLRKLDKLIVAAILMPVEPTK